MQPNESNQQPIDYLEEISTNPGSTGWPMKTKIIAGVCLASLLIIAGLMLFSPKDNSPLDLATLQYRTEISGKITAVGKKNIKNEDLLKLNSEITIFFSDFSRDIGVEISGDDTKKPTISSEIKKKEDIKEDLNELNDARLAGKFDSKFRSTMQLRLESIDTLAKSLEKNSKKKKVRELMTKKRKELKIWHDKFGALDLSKS